MPPPTTPNSTESTFVDDQVNDTYCGDGTAVLQNTVGVLVSKLSIAAPAGGGGGATVGSAVADVDGAALGVDAGVSLEDGVVDGVVDGEADGDVAEFRVSSKTSTTTSAASSRAPITAKTMMRLRGREASTVEAGGPSGGGVANSSVGLSFSGRSNFRVSSSPLNFLSVTWGVGNAQTTSA